MAKVKKREILTHFGKTGKNWQVTSVVLPLLPPWPLIWSFWPILAILAIFWGYHFLAKFGTKKVNLFLKSTYKSVYLQKRTHSIPDRHFDPKLAKIAFFVFYFFPDRTRTFSKFPKFSPRMQSKMWHLPFLAILGPSEILGLWRNNGLFFIKTFSKLNFRQICSKKVFTFHTQEVKKVVKIHVFFWHAILNRIF